MIEAEYSNFLQITENLERLKRSYIPSYTAERQNLQKCNQESGGLCSWGIQ